MGTWGSSLSKQPTIVSLCLILLLSTILLGDRPWLTKPASDWDSKDIEQILSDSPWATKKAVRIMPTEERGYRQSLSGKFGREHLYWVRFTWIAEPIRKACELIESQSLVLQIDSEVHRFVTAYRALESWENLSGQRLQSQETVLLLLQGDILSSLIGLHNEHDVKTAFLSIENGQHIEPSNLLFGLSSLSYERVEKGVERAVVEVEDLKDADLTSQPSIEHTPLSTLAYVTDLNKAQRVCCIVMTFPREGLGHKDVTLVVPLGGKNGLLTRFRLEEMQMAGKQSF